MTRHPPRIRILDRYYGRSYGEITASPGVLIRRGYVGSILEDKKKTFFCVGCNTGECDGKATKAATAVLSSPLLSSHRYLIAVLPDHPEYRRLTRRLVDVLQTPGNSRQF